MFKRSLRIIRLLSRYFLFYRFNRFAAASLGQRLRLFCSELGLTFMKIGQILSMRYDLLTAADCRELQSLLDDANPLPRELIEKILKAEYRRPVSRVFKNFSFTPISSASISQVHKATLPDGSPVAVKIKRPGVDECLKADIGILRAVARFAQIFSPTLRRVDILNVLEYFQNWLYKDTDFREEVRNMRLIYEQYEPFRKPWRSDLGVGILPLPYEKFCTGNIIVMDFIDGVSLNKADSVKDNPEYDVPKTVKSYVNAAARALFLAEEYIFQADPHLSNILALKHGDAANVDCGLIEKFTAAETKVTKELLLAVYLKDSEEVVRLSLAMSDAPYEKYKDIIAPDIRAYLQKAKTEGIGFWFIGIGRIFIKHRIKFPEFLLAFGRCNIILDSVIKIFFPGQSTVDILGEEFRRQGLKHIVNNIEETDLVPVFYGLSKQLKRSPELINDFLNRPEEALGRIKNFMKD